MDEDQARALRERVALTAAYELLDRMQGDLQGVLAHLFDCGDVRDASRSARGIEHAIEQAKNDVLAAQARRDDVKQARLAKLARLADEAGQ